MRRNENRFPMTRARLPPPKLLRAVGDLVSRKEFLMISDLVPIGRRYSMPSGFAHGPSRSSESVVAIKRPRDSRAYETERKSVPHHARLPPPKFLRAVGDLVSRKEFLMISDLVPIGRPYPLPSRLRSPTEAKFRIGSGD